MKTRIRECELDAARARGMDVLGVLSDPGMVELYGITEVVEAENGVGGFDLVVTHARMLPRLGGTKAVRRRGTGF